MDCESQQVVSAGMEDTTIGVGGVLPSAREKWPEEPTGAVRARVLWSVRHPALHWTTLHPYLGIDTALLAWAEVKMLQYDRVLALLALFGASTRMLLHCGSATDPALTAACLT